MGDLLAEELHCVLGNTWDEGFINVTLVLLAVVFSDTTALLLFPNEVAVSNLGLEFPS